MAYADHEEQLKAMRLWRKKRKLNNQMKKLGYTNEEIQWASRTLNNKEWRMSHLYRIVDKFGNSIVFKPNRAQKELMRGAHKRNIILKSRQLGFTTFECIDILDECLFKENFQSLMVFHTKVAAEDAFRNKITLAWELIPEAIRSRFVVDTDKAGEMRFKHSDGVYSFVMCRTSGMSGTYSRVHISEFGLIAAEEPRKADEIITGTFPAVSNGRLDIESTARGADGKYNELYMKALENDINNLEPTQFKPWFFNWTYDDAGMKLIEEPTKDIPQILRRYQAKHELSDIEITYYYNKIKETGLSMELALKKMRSEYPTTIEEAFEGSGDKLFDIDVVNKLILNDTKPGEQSNQWTYYENYRANRRYGIGVDVAEGIGRDASAITILDFTDCFIDSNKVARGKARVVATYVNDKIAPDILAYEIKNGARLYGNPIVAVEHNNKGDVTLNELKRIYPEKCLFRSIIISKIDNEQTERLGWGTNGSTKALMFYDLKTAVEEDRFYCPSRTMLNEMISYDSSKLNRTKDKESETHHWDLLTSCAIAYQMEKFSTFAQPKKKKVEDDNFNPHDII